MESKFFKGLLLCIGLLIFPNWAQCLETCQLYYNENPATLDGHADRFFQGLFRAGRSLVTLGNDNDVDFLSRDLSPEELQSLTAKNYQLNPKDKLTFTALGLIVLQESYDFALRKHQDQFQIYFTFEENGRKFHSFSAETADALPSCEEIKSQVDSYRSLRPYVLRALDERKKEDGLLGPEIILWESLESQKMGLGIPSSSVDRALESYGDLMTSLKDLVETLGQKNDLRDLTSEELLETLNRLRTQILRHGLTNYGRGRASIANYFNGEAANCVANSAIIFSLYLDLNLILPESMEFGVEVFTNHVQPVLVDRTGERVINLLTNEITQGLQSTVISRSGYEKLLLLHARSFLSSYDEIDVNLLTASDYILGFESRSTEFNSVDLENLAERSVEDPLYQALLNTRIDVFAWNFVGASESAPGETPFSTNNLGLLDAEYRTTEDGGQGTSQQEGTNSPIHFGLNEDILNRVTDVMLAEELHDYRLLLAGETPLNSYDNYTTFNLIRRLTGTPPSQNAANFLLHPLEFMNQDEAETYDHSFDSRFQFTPMKLEVPGANGNTITVYAITIGEEEAHLFRNRPIIEQYENLIARSDSQFSKLKEASLRVKQALETSDSIYELVFSDSEFNLFLDDFAEWFNSWKENQESIRDENHWLNAYVGGSNMEFFAQRGFPLISLRNQLIASYNQFFDKAYPKLKQSISSIDQLDEERLHRFVKRFRLVGEFVEQMNQLYLHYQQTNPNSERELSLKLSLQTALYEYFLRNKRFFFTTELSESEKSRFAPFGLTEVWGDPTNLLSSSDMEFLGPEINLPQVDFGDYCQRHSGPTWVGSIVINCPRVEVPTQAQDFIDVRRQPVLLKPQTMAAIISLASWDEILETPNLLMLFYSIRESVLPYLYDDHFGFWGDSELHLYSDGTERVAYLYINLIEILSNNLSYARQDELHTAMNLESPQVDLNTTIETIIQQVVLSHGGAWSQGQSFSAEELEDLQQDSQFNQMTYERMIEEKSHDLPPWIRANPSFEPAYRFIREILFESNIAPSFPIETLDYIDHERNFYAVLDPDWRGKMQVQGFESGLDRITGMLRNTSVDQRPLLEISTQSEFASTYRRGTFWDQGQLFVLNRFFYLNNTQYQSYSMVMSQPLGVDTPEEVLQALKNGQLFSIVLPSTSLMTRDYFNSRYLLESSHLGPTDRDSILHHESNIW